MVIIHVTRINENGECIPLSLCRYEDENGHPMAGSFWGHLQKETVNNMLKLYREADARIRR